MTGVRVERDVLGQIVDGNNNVVINARDGSTVSLRTDPPPPTPRRSPAASAVPRADIDLLGRDAEAATIGAWLDRREPVEIVGEPGIGKTALLRRIAAGRAANGVVYLSVAGLSRADLLQEIFQAFYDVENYRPEPARMRRLLGSVQTLLVLDDFDGDQDDLDAVLDAVPSSDVLISGPRPRMTGQGHTLTLRGLDQEAALALITRHLVRRLIGDEREAAVRLWRTAGGNPRALIATAVAVRRLRDADPDGELPLLRLDLAESALGPLIAHRLGDEGRRILATLAVFGAAALTRSALAAAADAPDEHVDALIESGLVDLSGSAARLSGPLAATVAAAAATPGAAADHAGGPPGAAVTPTVADLARRLTAWAGAARPRELATCTPALLHLFDRALAEGVPAAVLPLARAAAPRVALSLHWGAWSRVLGRGRDLARAAEATADTAYFQHEQGILAHLLEAVTTIAVATTAGTAAGVVASHTAGAATAGVPASPPAPPAGAGGAGGAGTPGSAGAPTSGGPLPTLTAKAVVAVVAVAAAVGVVLVATQGGSGPRTPTAAITPITTPTPFPSVPPSSPTPAPTTPTPTPTPTVPTATDSFSPEPARACDLDPDYYPFGEIAPGTTSPAQRLTLVSDCTYDRGKAAITGPDAAAFAIVPVRCKAGVVSGADCDLDLVFRPPANQKDASRTYQAAITLPQANGDIGVEDTLGGVGTAAPPPTCPAEAADTVTFPPARLGSSTSQVYEFRPADCPDLRYDMTAVPPAGTPFTVTRDPACPATLRAERGQVCRLTVTYAPSTVDQPDTATLTIPRSDGATRSLRLAGSLDLTSASDTPVPPSASPAVG